MNRIEKTLILKDLQEITGNKRILLSMIVMPLLMSVLIPLVLVLGANNIITDSIVVGQIGTLLNSLPSEYMASNPGQLMITIMVNYMFPTYFLIIPIMCSSVIGASSFVGEKEHKTMETLLYTPISMEQLLRAKILGVFISAFTIVLCSFICFGIIVNIGGLMYFERLIFPNMKWLIIIFWISPAITILSLTITALVSATSKSFQEAQQLSGLLVMPVFFGLIAQMSGLGIPSKSVMLITGAILFILDYILIKKVSKIFLPEKLVR